MLKINSMLKPAPVPGFYFVAPVPAALVRNVEAQIRPHHPTADDANVGDLAGATIRHLQVLQLQV